MKKSLIVVMVSICILLTVSSISYGQGVAPPSNTWQLGPMMKINNDAPCTTSNRVTLNYNRCTQAFPCHQPVDWKASENPNFTTCLQQGKTTRTWEYYNLCGKGRGKKVYFRTSLDNNAGSDEIDYLDNCDDPAIGALMQIQILKIYEPYRFDITSIFYVRKSNNANNFEINLQARAGAHNDLLAEKTMHYPATGKITGDLIETAMNLTIPVSIWKARHPKYGDIKLIVKVQPKPGATNTYDYNPHNNVLQKSLQLVSRTANPTFVVDKCTGPEGSKNNILSPVIQGWVLGKSTLSLHDCGTTDKDEIKCDNNPLPGVGQRGVKWTRRPSSGGQYALHWWCEGLANKRDTSQHKYYFRFNVKYDVVDIRIP
jgi:hypothetical protein